MSFFFKDLNYDPNEYFRFRDEEAWLTKKDKYLPNQPVCAFTDSHIYIY